MSKLSRSALYYRKNKKAREVKAETDKKINARPEQKIKRSELEKKRREAKKRGVNTSKSDYDHAVGRRVSIKTNRGRKGEGGRKRKK